MGRHLLIYDVPWWILGKNAKVIQQYHPSLDLMSMSELDLYLEHKSSGELNHQYDHISAMCLGIAAYCVFKNIRIDSAAAVSYYYFSKHYETYREWEDELVPDPDFLRLVIPRIGKLGAINRKLASILQAIAPNASVEYIGHFVDDKLFQPLPIARTDNAPFVIGWAGDPSKTSKNYNTLYMRIKEHFKSDEGIAFIETSGAHTYESMPGFYHKLNLLLNTGANEGSGATVLEAYACGVPVLSTNVGNAKEAAHPAAHGLILDSDSPEDFILKIDYWRSRTDELREIGLRCRSHIESGWSIDHAMSRWLRVLFQI